MSTFAAHIPVLCNPLRLHNSCGGESGGWNNHYFLLLIFIFILSLLIYYDWVDYCVTCVQHMFTINLDKKAAIYKAYRPGPTSGSTIYFTIFARMTLAPIGSLTTFSKCWGPTRTHPSSRQSRWRLGWAENQPEVACCTLKALLPLEGIQLRKLNIILYAHLVIQFLS